MQELPPGIKLKCTLTGHSGGVQRIAWSRDGSRLASASVDYSTAIWNASDGTCSAILREARGYAFDVTWNPSDELLAVACSAGHIAVWDTNAPGRTPVRLLTGHHNVVLSVDWHPTASLLASGGWDMVGYVWDYERQDSPKALVGHKGEIVMARWSPDGHLLATASGDKTVRLWDPTDGAIVRALEEHGDRVLALAFSPDGRLLATGCGDRAIRLWEVNTGKLAAILERHNAAITSVSFSANGKLLASKGRDNTVMIFDTQTLDRVAVMEEPASSTFYPGLSFHPHENTLATLGEGELAVRFWEISEDELLHNARLRSGSVTYSNAKVMIVGEPTVGKTALGLVLSGHKYRPTDSTHNRNVWTVALTQHEIAPGVYATRELLIWDLAGQPGYRLVHNLHLGNVQLALLVFDAKTTSDPFRAIRYWVQILRGFGGSEQGGAMPTFFLVSSRRDVGPVPLSQERIHREMESLGISKYFETSAKTGENIDLLRDAIATSIDWDSIPVISSTRLFLAVRDFIISERTSARVLVSEGELCRAILDRLKDSTLNAANISACIEQLTRTGLVFRLRIGKLVLLRPEILDSYCAALLNSAQADSDGAGSIAERDALQSVRIHVPQTDRIEDSEDERLVLGAAIEALLASDLAFRQDTAAGTFLVFPSQLTREVPEIKTSSVLDATWHFIGPPQNIYATLAVRLAHSNLFEHQKLWRNLSSYTSYTGAECMIRLVASEDASGQLQVSFEPGFSLELRRIVDLFIEDHLEKRSSADSVRRSRIVACSCEAFTFPPGSVEERIRRGFDYIACPICDGATPLGERTSPASPLESTQKRLAAVEASIESAKEASISRFVFESKVAAEEFDVFLSYNRTDSKIVDQINLRLRRFGITAWIDRQDSRPFVNYHEQLQNAILKAGAAAICLGAQGIGHWQEKEIAALIEESHRRELRLGVVLLPGFNGRQQIPLFLKHIQYVDLSHMSEEEFDQLAWGITGKRTNESRSNDDDYGGE